METKCRNVIEELQQTHSKVKHQEKKIENLQKKLTEAKEELDQLVYDRKNVIQVQQSHYINISLQKAYHLVWKQQFD